MHKISKRHPSIRTRPDEGPHSQPLRPTAAAPLYHGHRRRGQDPHAINRALTEIAAGGIYG